MDGERRVAGHGGDAEVGEHGPAVVVTSTLLGFTSRCTTPCACAVSSAARTPRPISATAARRQRPVVAQDLAQAAGLEQLHDDPGPAVLLDDVVGRDHVGVARAGRWPAPRAACARAGRRSPARRARAGTGPPSPRPRGPAARRAPARRCPCRPGRWTGRAGTGRRSCGTCRRCSSGRTYPGLRGADAPGPVRFPGPATGSAAGRQGLRVGPHPPDEPLW